MRTYCVIALMALIATTSAYAQTASAHAQTTSAHAQTASATPAPATLEQVTLDAKNLNGLVQQLQRSVDPSGVTVSINSVQNAAQIEQLAARIKRATKNHPPAK